MGPVGGPPDEAAVEVARGDEGDVVEVGAAGERVVDDDVAARARGRRRRRWRPAPTPASSRGAPGCARPARAGRRPAVNSAAEQSARSLMFGLKARAAQGGAHLLGDAGQPGEEHGEAGRAEAHGRATLTPATGRRRTRAPAAPGSARQPGGTQVVQSASAMTAGPVDRRRRSGGREVGDGDRARRWRRRARSAIDLDGVVGAGVAVAPGVEVVEVGHRIDGELVALPGVAAVDGGRDLRRRIGTDSAPHELGNAAAARAARAASRPAWSSGVGHDRTTSTCSGAASSPTAENTPARAGTITAGIPSASASAQACSGPAPPNATSASPPGRRPAPPTPPAAPRPWWRRRPSTTSAASHPGAGERAARRAHVEHADAREARRPPRSARARDRRRSPSAPCRPGRSTPARARRRPTRGPTASAPPASSAAIDPPPAPIVWMASAGSRTG